MKYYLAYGSNMSFAQMKKRCPDAVPVGTATIKGHRLVFKYHASIEPQANCEVPVGVWKISDEDEARLDMYEGYPEYYEKRNVDVIMKTFKPRRKKRINALVYVMNGTRLPCPPALAYYHGIQDGYADFGINEIPLRKALDNSLYLYTKAGND